MKKEKSNRRDFIKQIGLTGAGLLLMNRYPANAGDLPTVEPETLNLRPVRRTPFGETAFTLPVLPYAYDSLEPFIDKQTMELHHGKHHQAYVDKLNKALVETKTSGITLDDLCKNISKYSATVRNNGGGHYNHSLFWKGMKPNSASVLTPSSPNEPAGKLGDAIKSTFDSFANFKTKYSEAAMKVFGSGWAWLVINKDGKLEIGSTPNQDNPLMDLSELKGNPILGLDVWEHAYYLKYQNKRVDYISNWWNVVNWEEAAKRYEI